MRKVASSRDGGINAADGFSGRQGQEAASGTSFIDFGEDIPKDLGLYSRNSIADAKGIQVASAEGAAAKTVSDVITVTPDKQGGSIADQASAVASKVAPKAAARLAGAAGGILSPSNEGRQSHDIKVGGEDMAFDYGPGDLTNPVYRTDPKTGERVNTGLVAIPSGIDDDGHQKFDLMPEAEVEGYLTDRLQRTDIAEPMPPIPASEADGIDGGYREEYPATNPDDLPPVPGYPDQSPETGPYIETYPDQSDEIEQGTVLDMANPYGDMELGQGKNPPQTFTKNVGKLSKETQKIVDQEVLGAGGKLVKGTRGGTNIWYQNGTQADAKAEFDRIAKAHGVTNARPVYEDDENSAQIGEMFKLPDGTTVVYRYISEGDPGTQSGPPTVEIQVKRLNMSEKPNHSFKKRFGGRKP